MALADRNEMTITIKFDGVLEVRLDRIITEDGADLTTVVRRAVFTPDMDPATLPARVRRAANAFWDAATVAAYKAAHGA
jgi:hypothetical protein